MSNEKITKGSQTRTTDERGAGLVEYALLVALIAVIAIVAMRTLGRTISKQFSTIASQL